MQFLAALSEDERRHYSPCASVDDLLEGLSKLEMLTKVRLKRLANRVVSGIKRFHDQLRPFFGVINNVVQCDPTYAAPIWGALRLILEVYTAYTFRSSVCKLIQIAASERLCGIL